MKLNELKGSRAAYIVISGEEGTRLEQIDVRGVFTSMKEAERLLATEWWSGGNAISINDEDDSNEIAVVETINTFLKSPRFSLDKFLELVEKLQKDYDFSYQGPSLEEYFDFSTVVESSFTNK